MAVLNKGLWWILGAMAIGLAVSLSAGLYFRGEAKALREENKSVQADLAGLRMVYEQLIVQQKRRTTVDVQQSTTRASTAQAVRAVRAKIKKESANANDSHPTASDAQLIQLRELTATANASIRTASELP